MFTWQQAPFIRPTIAAISGVWIGYQWTIPSELLVVGAFIVGVFYLLIGVGFLKKLNLLFGPLFLISIAMTFSLWVSYQKVDFLEEFSNQPVQVSGTITEISEYPQNIKLTLSIDCIASLNRQKQPANQRIFVYTPLGGSPLLAIGDRIEVVGELQKLTFLKNPDAFDYGAWLARKNLRYKIKVSDGLFQIRMKSSNGSLGERLNRIKKWGLHAITTHIKNKQAQGIVMAMTLGDRDHLDEHIKESYREAGVMHTLALSGLHVGILTALLMGLLKIVLPTSKEGIWVKCIITLLVLWSYVFITGAGPSVVRAGILFSVLAIDFCHRGIRNSFNFLAFAAFVSLVYNPLWLFDIGFQFSFLAVGGILTFYPLFKQLNPWSKLKLPTLVFDMVAISAAAQLTIAPLSLYYFHQFPTYFWLASLWAIPFTFIIVSQGMILMVLGGLMPGAGEMVGATLSWLTDVLNTGIEYVQGLPYSCIKNVTLHEWEVLMLYVLILLLYKKWNTRLLRYSWMIYALIIGLVISRSIHYLHQSHARHIVVYAAYGQSIIDFINAKERYTYSITRSEPENNFVSAAHRLRYSCDKALSLNEEAEMINSSILCKNGVVAFGNVVLMIPEQELPTYYGRVDYLLLTKAYIRKTEELISLYQPATILLDGSLAPWEKEKLKKRLANQKVIDVIQTGGMMIKT